MKNDKQNSVSRFRVIFCLMVCLGVYVLSVAVQLMIPPQSDYWRAVEKRFTRDSISIPASRGNLYGCDGKLLVGSLPEYRLYLDFKVGEPDSARKVKLQAWRDSMFLAKKDSIATGLAKIFPKYNKAWFLKRLEAGKKRGGWSYLIYPHHATYIQYMECKSLPLLREASFKGGFHAEEILKRKKPYGRLAQRTLGELYQDSNAAKCGLELSFDSILRGVPGISHRTKIRNSRLSIVDRSPENGHDLVTTIDIGMQDQADRILRRKLHELNAEVGVAVVMETHTGDVKAIVNLTRGGDGNYYEMKNNAVSDLWEPGSTFKTASIMVGLDDGTIRKDDKIDTGNGIYMMYGRPMKDHNWRKGGYQTLSVTQVLGYSSNIGVSRLIDRAYHDDPDRYVRGLNKLGVGIPLNLPFVGKGEPRVRHPEKKGRYWVNWSNTALPWMSIGYETMLTPMNTLTFYNAIANNGRMVKPRFITAELKDGNVIRKFPTEVIKESICKPQTLADIQEILEKVVSEGLGKKAGNGGKYFKVSGKTGTAQIASNGGYHNGMPKYMVSFCGYFPSEAPQYSCIVCIVKNGSPASGGGQAGPVFSEIAQYVMSKGTFRNAELAADSNSVYIPEIHHGNQKYAKEVLNKIGVDSKKIDWNRADTTKQGLIPDLSGMGARDAVYTVQALGMKAKIHGKGRVIRQSITPNTKPQKGATIILTLKEPGKR